MTNIIVDAHASSARAASAVSFGAARAHQELALRYEKLVAAGDLALFRFSSAANHNEP